MKSIPHDTLKTRLYKKSSIQHVRERYSRTSVTPRWSSMESGSWPGPLPGSRSTKDKQSGCCPTPQKWQKTLFGCQAIAWSIPTLSWAYLGTMPTVCLSMTAASSAGTRAQHICITFAQRRLNVFDVGPTLYKCYTIVLCLLGTSAIGVCMQQPRGLLLLPCTDYVTTNWHTSNLCQEFLSLCAKWQQSANKLQPFEQALPPQPSWWPYQLISQRHALCVSLFLGDLVNTTHGAVIRQTSAALSSFTTINTCYFSNHFVHP